MIFCPKHDFFGKKGLLGVVPDQKTNFVSNNGGIFSATCSKWGQFTAVSGVENVMFSQE